MNKAASVIAVQKKWLREGYIKRVLAAEGG